MKRWKKLMIALAAIASIYVVRATGLDGGLIDDAFNALVEAVTSEDAVPAQPPVEAPSEAK